MKRFEEPQTQSVRPDTGVCILGCDGRWAQRCRL